MKKLISGFFFLMLANFAFADYTDSIAVNTVDVKLSKKDSFDVISISGYDYITTPGSPQLPAKYIHVIIPSDKRVSQIVINSITENDFNSTLNVFPVQELQNMSAPLNPFTQPDTSIYNNNQFYPQSSFNNGRIGNFNGAKIYTVQFCPVKYNPVTGKLKLITSISYTIVYETDLNQFFVPTKIGNSFYNDICLQLSTILDPSAKLTTPWLT